MNNDKDRAEFEAWAAKYGPPLVRNAEYPDEYALSRAQNQWIGWQASAARSSARIAELEADKLRLDWLSDPKNKVGQVLLPTAIVERNLDSLRDAIDEVMKGGA